MELSMKVALMVFLLGLTASVVVDGTRFDASESSLMSEVSGGDLNNYYVKSTTEACCDSCACTKSIPPQCRCADIGETCHSACKTCLCTRSFPPQCRCTDITDFCYKPCNSFQAQAQAH